MPLHHVAYATRDVEATTHFYEDLMGFPLVHAELQAHGESSWVRHVFYDIGGGECIAFFQFENVGEKPDWSADVSAGVGLPVWPGVRRRKPSTRGGTCAYVATRASTCYQDQRFELATAEIGLPDCPQPRVTPPRPADDHNAAPCANASGAPTQHEG